MIMRRDDGTTSPTLLRRAADWSDLPAWREFFARYDPLLRDWCRRYLADESEVCEVTQRIWLELADRIIGFRYDPGKTFRGWLRDLCRCRAIDFVRARERQRKTLIALSVSLAEEILDDRSFRRDDDLDDDLDALDRALILREAEAAQALIKARVSPRTWETFWRIAIDGESIRTVAGSMEMTYAAAFAAYSRVDRMLREEGRRRLAAAAH